MAIPPSISVLLPVYNAERYLRQAVESVLAQTFTNFELLALDDGSTDSSLSILREFGSRDCRVRILCRENRGLVPTLNELIAEARAPYLARMDADDICHPRRFEKQAAYLDANSRCVIVGTRSLAIDPDGMPIREFVDDFGHLEIDSGHLTGGGSSRMCHPSVVMRKSAVVQVGQYRDEYRFAEDLDLFLRLAEIGEIANIPEVLICYRLHLDSLCHTHQRQQRRNAKRALMTALTRRGLQTTSEIKKLGTIETSADLHRKWAWWALSAGNLRTARKHAARAFAKGPFNIENVRVVACTIRGH